MATPSVLPDISPSRGEIGDERPRSLNFDFENVLDVGLVSVHRGFSFSCALRALKRLQHKFHPVLNVGLR